MGGSYVSIGATEQTRAPSASSLTRPALTSSRPGPGVNQSVTTGNFCTYERGSVASMETRRRHRV